MIHLNMIGRIKQYMESKEVKDAAELEVRRYFDHFLKNIYPTLMIEHGHSCKHGQLLNKIKWIMVGMAATFILSVPTIGKELIGFIIKIAK